MSDFAAGLALLADPAVILALFIGSIGGVIIGAIPGVGAAVAIAILLPATFSLDPLVGLTMLLGIYGSSMYGGSLPAILINTPGTAVNALTTYDGHPMTKRGEALRALGLAYGASFVGGTLSIIALILFSPVLAKVAPMFGSRGDLPRGAAGHRAGDPRAPGPDAGGRIAGGVRHPAEHHRAGAGALHAAVHLRAGPGCRAAST